MEPRAVLIAQKSFVFLVFLMPSVILIIFGVDMLPGTEAIICICIGSTVLAVYIGYTLYAKFCKSANIINNSIDLPVLSSTVDDSPPSYEGESSMDTMLCYYISRGFTSQSARRRAIIVKIMISTEEIVGFSVGTVVFACGCLAVLLRHLNKVETRTNSTSRRSVRFREDYPEY